VDAMLWDEEGHGLVSTEIVLSCGALAEQLAAAVVGQMSVQLRTNIAFTNRLSKPVSLARRSNNRSYRWLSWQLL
jgi:hypothetical protein